MFKSHCYTEPSLRVQILIDIDCGDWRNSVTFMANTPHIAYCASLPLLHTGISRIASLGRYCITQAGHRRLHIQITLFLIVECWKILFKLFSLHFSIITWNMRYIFVLASSWLETTFLGDIEDAELLYNSYYDPVLYPVVLPESPLEDAEPEADEPTV